MRAWLFQDHRQKEKLGEKKCPWSVGWYDPDGKKRAKRIGTRSHAEKFRCKVVFDLQAGTYRAYTGVAWSEFRATYKRRVTDSMDDTTRKEMERALDAFERIIKPVRADVIKTTTVDDFITERRKEPGRKKDAAVSPATVNKELRHIKAAIRRAHEWDLLPAVPKFHMLREPEKLVRYVTAEHFASIYAHCGDATMPKRMPFSAGEWWQALLIFGYMTGWRISEILSLRREDLDWREGTAITRYGDNKGGREERVKLHPVVLDHLKTIASFEPVIFPWYHDRRTLDSESHRIQRAAGVHLPCRENHEHTPACHVYGFHDLRRAFATANAGKLSGDVLQKLMRHKSYQTTQRYINMASRVDEAVEVLTVPAFKVGTA